MTKIAVILGDGVEGKGGTEKATGYFTTYLRSINFTEFDVRVMKTRVGESNIVRHLTTPLTLAYLFFHFLFNRYALAHVNIGPKGSTFRKIGVCLILVVLRVPYIVHLHGSGYDTYYRKAPGVLQYFIRFMFLHALYSVVLGDLWRDFAVADLGVKPEKIRIVYNGVPDHGVSSYRTQDIIRITSMGLVGTRKGMDVLLQALSMLPKQIEWRCTIGGNGEIDRYKQIARELGIGERIEFAGWVDEAKVYAMLHEADIFVLASRYENQPLTILEAMAAGLPVISTLIGAIPEQVIDGVSGILIEPGDAKALLEALLRLIEAPQTRQAMGQAGRLRYEENFSAKAFSENILSVYREALAKIDTARS